MTIEDYIVFRVNALLHAHDAKIVMRLEGGMSNYTYVVECQGKKYTYRVPGKFAEKFVDREEEWANIQEVNRLGLNNITEYVEIRSGEKLAEYVEGTIMSTTDVVSYNEMSVKALKKIHNSDMKFRDYNAFGRLDDDQRYCLETGYVFPQEYLDLRKKLDAIRATQVNVPKVPCHCDYQPTNLVISGDKLYGLRGSQTHQGRAATPLFPSRLPVPAMVQRGHLQGPCGPQQGPQHGLQRRGVHVPRNGEGFAGELRQPLIQEV